MSPERLRREGTAALIERLGPGGALAFLRQCGAGAGDYTACRAEVVGHLTLEELLAEALATKPHPDASG
jgi:hypothetical protein